MTWWRISPRADEWREEAREHIGDGRALRTGLIVAAVALLAIIALGMYWSREPAQFAVQGVTTRLLPKHAAVPVTGSTTAATLIVIVDTLLDKPGGFIANDVTPPGVWLDNMPNWEYGALTQARDLLLVLRETTSRSQIDATGAPITLSEDEALARAEPRLNFAHDSWLLPASESQYRDARDYLQDYLARLQTQDDGRAHFDASARNLDIWLQKVALRLGNLSQRLSACVQPQENPMWSTPTNLPLTPAGKIDDVFYEARGSTWALLHLLRAAEFDYAAVLRQYNAQPLLHEAVADLEQAQARIFSPLILNGRGFGPVANHSLVMASYIARANAAVINLRNVLTPPPSALPAPN